MSRELYTQKPAKGSYYPTYFRNSQKKRGRTFAWLDVDLRHNKVTVIDEHGVHYRFGRSEYHALRDAAIQHQWTLFSHFGAVSGRYPWLVEALQDQSATLLASGRFLERGKSLSGIEWRKGRHRAKVVNPDSWGWSELNHGDKAVSVRDFLSAVRRTCDAVGVGDFDTPAGLGTEALQKAWQDSKLGLLWILPKELRDWFHQSPSHPRIWDADTGSDVHYDGLIEFDLRSAYATALAGRLALGQPSFVSQAEAASDLVRGTALRTDGETQAGATHEQERTGISYGLWRVEVKEPILRGPVRWLWSGTEPGFNIEPGEYAVPLFGEQACALASCGATVTWLRGYYWERTGTPFAGYVATMKALRRQAEDEGDAIRAAMLKRLPNAAIGRFNCYQSSTVVPESEAVEGDAIFSLGASEYSYSSPEDATLAAVHTSSAPTCVPEHWYHHIVSTVGLIIWKAERIATAWGHTVVSANIDSYRILQPTLQLDAEMVPDTSTWKTVLIKDATIRASRSIDGWMSCDSGVSWVRLVRAPGVRRA